MNGTVEPSTSAWQPLTPRGVAAFARASRNRLLLLECVVAALAAAVVIWFLHAVWFPTIREAIRQMPPQGQIRQGKLAWRGESPVHLAGDRFLAVVVDLNHEAEVGREADVSIELGQRDCQILSLLGYMAVNYPAGWVVAFNRTELEPWWGAWEPVLLAGAGMLMALGLLAIWALLATLYSPVAMLAAFLADRNLDWRGGRRLATAALMPGALALTAAILFYGWGALDFVRLAICAVGHFVVGWLYLLVSPLFLPWHPAVQITKGNPFAGPRAGSKP